MGPSTGAFHLMSVWWGLTGACRGCSCTAAWSSCRLLWAVSLGALRGPGGTLRGKRRLRCTAYIKVPDLPQFRQQGPLRKAAACHSQCLLSQAMPGLAVFGDSGFGIRVLHLLRSSCELGLTGLCKACTQRGRGLWAIHPVTVQHVCTGRWHDQREVP